MRILVLVAGTNDASNSATLASAFSEGIAQLKDVHTDTHRLKNLSIEHFSLEHYDPAQNQEKDFCMLQELILQADGVVIAAPVWNFSVPAHLKNLIDRMGSFALDERKSQGTLNGKPFYLIFTGGSPAPAWRGIIKKTISHIPEGLKYFGGSIAGIHFEPRCTLKGGKFGLVVDARPESLKNMREKGLKFGMMVQEFAVSGTLPLKQTIIKKCYGIGQRMIKKIT